jgi:hypothetical protein
VGLDKNTQEESMELEKCGGENFKEASILGQMRSPQRSPQRRLQRANQGKNKSPEEQYPAAKNGSVLKRRVWSILREAGEERGKTIMRNHKEFT